MSDNPIESDILNANAPYLSDNLEVSDIHKPINHARHPHAS